MADHPTKREVEAMLERAEKATKGPWVSEKSITLPNLQVNANAIFVGHARTDLPELAKAYLEAMAVLQHCAVWLDAAGQAEIARHIREVIAAYHAQEDKPE